MQNKGLLEALYWVNLRIIQIVPVLQFKFPTHGPSTKPKHTKEYKLTAEHAAIRNKFVLS